MAVIKNPKGQEVNFLLINSSGLSNRKNISQSDFKALRQELRSKALKVIHCHGVFDLLHPGHIAHLEEAKLLGDILVVSITSSSYVNKGPGRPYFSDELRLQSLAALSCVDYVLLSENTTALDILDVIQPDFYVKGQEYANAENDVTQNIDREAEKVRSYGGDIYFSSGITFSSTKLLNNCFPVFPQGVKEFSQEFSTKYSFEKIRKMIDSMQDLKVLVIGDIIIDEYVFCTVQGLMSKDRALSAKHERDEIYLGGSLAIARHLANFSNNVTVCGIVGDEPNIHSRILEELGCNMMLDLQFNQNFKTVTKRRFLERYGIRKEYHKLFSINYLPNEPSGDQLYRSMFYRKLEQNIGQYDLVVLADYGHGLVDQTVMDIVQEKANFLALNCQTNSTNHGANLITKYHRADMFTLDEKEIRLALSSNTEDTHNLLIKLMKHFNGNTGWLTLGSLGSLSIDNNNSIEKTPALTLTVQDTVGAGDAFFALTSLCACLKYPNPVGSFVGNIAGALAANIMGNAQAVKKADLLKFASTILNI